MDIKLLKLFLIMLISSSIASAQNLSSARGISLAASSLSVNDASAIDWNPAAIGSLHDIEINITNSISSNSKGFSLISMSGVKKITDRQAIAIAYTPGRELKFILPALLTILDSAGNPVLTKYDREITYYQTIGAGYSIDVSKYLSLGTAFRIYGNDITDLKYFIDSTNTIGSRLDKNSISIWSLDFGSTLAINDYWKVGGTVKNLAYGRTKNFPDDLDDLRLKLHRVGVVGASFKPSENFLTAIEGDTEQQIRIGLEWIPYENFYLRTGLYTLYSNANPFEAIALGTGFNIDRFAADIGYIWFPSKTNRGGTINLSTFSSTNFTNLDYSRFTSDQLLLTLRTYLGSEFEPLAIIEGVDIKNEIYPASAKIFAFTPVGTARVRNNSSKRISTKIGFFISEVMNTPTESMPYNLEPEEILEIPFNAVFNNKIDSVKKLSIYDGLVFVKAKIAEEYDDRYQTRVLVRGRNDWNGDVYTLHYFVKPGDSKVLDFSRNVIHNRKNHFDTIPGQLQNFEKARALFDSLTHLLRYINDPRLSRDYVQYPEETLTLYGGDCDDITVCYASLLMSIGISAAFVDVIPQDNASEAHIYLLFDTGIPPQDANYLTDNPKRYCIRRSDSNKETVWIPVETTMLKKGFMEAWNKGAEQYYKEAEIGLGIVKGWIKVVDIIETQ